jgi:hypothetical protein
MAGFNMIFQVEVVGRIGGHEAARQGGLADLTWPDEHHRAGTGECRGNGVPEARARDTAGPGDDFHTRIVPCSKVFVIRRSLFPEGPGESFKNTGLSYPCATEHEGRLYVGYSNNGPARHGNQNSAELAIIPIEKLAVE